MIDQAFELDRLLCVGRFGEKERPLRLAPEGLFIGFSFPFDEQQAGRNVATDFSQTGCRVG